MLYPGNGKPLFIQLRDLLLQRINEGEYAAGDRLPGERQLCGFYGISRVTVRVEGASPSSTAAPSTAATVTAIP